MIKPGDKVRLAKKAYEWGHYYQSHKRCCSQSTVAAMMETLDFKDEGVFKASTSLAAGGAMFGDSSCGAYVGGLLIIGLLRGRPMDNFIVEETDRFRSFEVGRALHKRFIKEYGTVICRDIMTKLCGRPFWLTDPDEYNKAEEAGLHTTMSPCVVGNAAKWTTEVIFDENLLDELNQLRKKYTRRL